MLRNAIKEHYSTHYSDPDWIINQAETGKLLEFNIDEITNANYLLPYTGAGTGIVRAMKEKPDVTFENMKEAHEFVIVIRRKANQESNQESVQENIQESVQEKLPKEKTKVTLTKVQKDIVNYCTVPKSAKEIMDRIGIINHSANRKRHIQPLLEMGALEMTNPDNPKDRNQKYRKVMK